MTDQIFPPQTQTSILPAPAPSAAVSSVEPVVKIAPPKKRFSKGLLFAIIGLVLIALVLVLVFKNAGKKKGIGGEITWWGLWEDESVTAPLIAEYEKANPKVKVKYVKQSKEDYRERLTNALAKGTGPDIFRFHNSWVPMFKNELDRLPASVMSAADFTQTFYPVATVDLTGETGILGIPLEYDALTLYINEDIFMAAGKTPPVTWDDLRTLAIALTQKDDQGNIIQSGVALGRTENVDHWPEILALMMLQNGVDLTRPTGKLAEDALVFYSLFSSTDGVWDATLPSSTDAFAAGKLAMYFGPSWRALNITEQNPSLKFKTVPLPQLPKSGTAAKDVYYATYWAEGVWTKSKNKETAWDFLKFISAKDSLTKMYTNASRQRQFGEPYSRLDLASLLTGHPIIGSIISGANSAQSWYLQSRTWDGPTGINSLINKYFEDAINAVNSGTSAEKALEPVAQGVSQVLGQYGLVGK